MEVGQWIGGRIIENSDNRGSDNRGSTVQESTSTSYRYGPDKILKVKANTTSLHQGQTNYVVTYLHLLTNVANNINFLNLTVS